MERVLVERFVEALLTNADDLSAYLDEDVELVTLLDGRTHSGKRPVLAVLRRTAENTLHLDDWAITDHGPTGTVVRARFVGRLPSNVVQHFDVVWRLTFDRGLIRRIVPYTDEEEARRAEPSAT